MFREKNIIIAKLVFIFIVAGMFFPETVYGTTNFFIKPENIQGLYFPDNSTKPLIEVTIQGTDIENLKEYHLSISYNSQVLDYLYAEIDPLFENNSRGILGGPMNGILATPFTGSSPMFRLYFTVNSTGTSIISIEESVFRNDQGVIIDYSSLDCKVEIESFEEYFDSLISEYENTLETTEREIIGLEAKIVESKTNQTILRTQILENELKIDALLDEKQSLITELENKEGIPGYPIETILVGIIIVSLIWIRKPKYL